MRYLFILPLTVLLGCGYSEYAQNLPEHTVSVGGVERAYHLYVPSARVTRSMPLVVFAHGAGGRDFKFPQQGRFEDLAEREGIVLAFPLSRHLDGNEGEWQLNTAEGSRQDVEFIEALIDDVSGRHRIDAARVYAVGYSLGSMFTYELACHLNHRFAAVASYAGTMPIRPHSCQLQDELAILHLHGRDDHIISYDQTWDWKRWDQVGEMMDLPQLVEYWTRRLGCQQQLSIRQGNAHHLLHSECAGDVRVEHYALDEVGHEWPEAINGESTHDVIWSFLSDFSKSRD